MNRHVPLAAALLLLVALVPLPALADVGFGDRPAIRFQTLTGQTVTSSDLRGRLVVVHFWRGAADNALTSIDDLVQIYEKYRPQGVQIISVCMHEDTDGLRAVVREKGMTWPQCQERQGPNSKLARDWGVRWGSRLFLLSPEGEVLWLGNVHDLRDALTEALEKHPPSVGVLTTADLAVEKLAKVARLVAAKQYEDALTLIADIPDEALTDKRVVRAGMALALKLKPEGADREKITQALAANYMAADKLKLFAEAAAKMVAAPARTTTAPASQPAADDDASAAKPDLAPLAQVRLEDAQASKARGQHLQAYEDLQRLVQRFPETPAALVAAELITAYETDPVLKAELRKAQAQRDARAALAIAQGYLDAGKTDLARAKFQDVIDHYPDTPSAQAARDALKTLH